MKRGPSPSALLLLWLVVAPALASATTPVFLLDTDEVSFADLYRVDPRSGELTPLGSLPMTVGPTLALAAASATRLYAVSQGGEVLEIGLEPFAVASLGNIGPNNLASLGFAGGALYGTEENSGSLFRIEVPSLAVALVGVVHAPDGSPIPILGGDLAQSRSGDWYLWSNATGALYALDVSDATATVVSPKPSDLGALTGLAFDHEAGGALVGSSRTRDALVTLDPASGAGTSEVPFCLACPAPFDASFGDLASPPCSHGECFACPRPPAYWKRHPDAWPVLEVTLGERSYAREWLLGLLRAPAHGDARAHLARHLVAARLSLSSGADPAPVREAIARADALLVTAGAPGSPRVRPGTRLGRALLREAAFLAAYDHGRLTRACGDRRPRESECRDDR